MGRKTEIVKKTKKKILLVVNTMTYTGAPRCALHMCLVLLENDFHVEVWSWCGGSFEKEFIEKGVVPRIIDPSSLGELQVKKSLLTFDLIIANTICTYQIVQLCQEMIPTIWYIHESKSMMEFLSRNKRQTYAWERAHNIYVVSEYAKQFIWKQFALPANVLHNCIEDSYRGVARKEKDSNKVHKIKFLALGTIIEIKAYDIFIHAYMSMNRVYQEKCELHFAGQSFDHAYSRKILQEIQDYTNIHYYGEIKDRTELFTLIAEADVVVVVSREESCSLVVLEACMMQKPVVVSCNVGAKYLVNEENGWIVATESVDELRSVYQEIIDHPEELEAKGRKSRQFYLETSTYEIFEKNLLRVVRDNIVSNKYIFCIGHLAEKWKHAYFRKVLDNPFLMDDIKRNKKIILYGAGHEGKQWHTYLSKTQYCKMVCWADENFENIGQNIVSPKRIMSYTFDYVLVAIGNENSFNEIRKNLVGIGVPREKIRWLESFER